ncbi:phospholipase a2 [Fusarium heterosporum]|uniref:Lysophospholipase n=1 Tax=Fusarium heterosporum TaxID=42747 RepID=A0A8H5U158_FUSHE|nr:phospholipase a2 [Fusarium heterosporum]
MHPEVDRGIGHIEWHLCNLIPVSFNCQPPVATTPRHVSEDVIVTNNSRVTPLQQDMEQAGGLITLQHVSLVQATPVSSRLRLTNTATRFRKGRIVTTRPSPHSVERETQYQATKSISSRNSLSGRASKIVQKWYQRASDLASVKTLLERDKKDVATYPELDWDARVRDGSSLHPEERSFIELRKLRISSDGQNSLHRFLNLPPEEKIDPRDVPLIALGGSGGGYRVMYGFAGFISAAKKLCLWDCITWTAGVSGSCWTLAAYYTIARQDITRLTDHYLTMASELAHPLSIQALTMVARSKKGIYFLIGPLVSKAQNGIIGLSMMDLYSTLTATYQLLSRGHKGGLGKATFQWSKTWHRSGIGMGLEPMPILASVRRVPRYSFQPKTISANNRAIKKTSSLQDPSLANGSKTFANSQPRKFFQYFEISPLEIGSPDINRYVPTWSWGRTFVSGHSVDRRPEQSFSLLLVSLFNKLLQTKQLEGLWGNPIRAGHDPNPFYGLERPLRSRKHTSEHATHRSHTYQNMHHDDDLTPDTSTSEEPPNLHPWEAQGRTRLMDCGMANNLPNHVLARPERAVDVFISFDASSDIHTGAAVQRLHHFAADINIELLEVTETFHKPRNNDILEGQSARKIESQYLDNYARVFRGNRRNGQKIYIVYCPLLSNGMNPKFNPSTAPFSTSTNLVWTPDQVKNVL